MDQLTPPNFPPCIKMERLNALLFLCYGGALCGVDMEHSVIYGRWVFAEPQSVSPLLIALLLIVVGLIQYAAVATNRCYLRLLCLLCAITFWGTLIGFYVGSVHPLGIIFPAVFTFGFLLPGVTALARHLRLGHKDLWHELGRLAPE